MSPLDGFSKALETLIKAPLWVFLALALAATAPLLPTPFVNGIGLNRALKIAGLPIAIYAILFWCFFLSSALANSYSTVGAAVHKRLTQNAYQRKYLPLSADARLLLFLTDENNLFQIRVPSGELAVRELRDAGLLDYDGPYSTDGSVGVFKPTMSFFNDMIYHRQWLRAFLREKVRDTTAFEERLRLAQHAY